MSANTPQPPPKTGTAAPTWELVIADMRERDSMGSEKYGVRHQHDNGRDHLVDDYQECLDLAVYLRAEIERRAAETRRKPIDDRVSMLEGVTRTHSERLGNLENAGCAVRAAGNEVQLAELRDRLALVESRQVNLTDMYTDLVRPPRGDRG